MNLCNNLIIWLTLFVLQTSLARESIVFYNAENLFDHLDDTLKNDQEFLPQSLRKWTAARFSNKITYTYKAIASVSEEVPMLIGLCEVENKNVHYNLLKHTPLSNQNYRFIHYESRDLRGIDVALLYQVEKLKLIHSEAIPVVILKDTLNTRDILYAAFENLYNDTLHVFVNHWPSRRGGKEASASRRMACAKILKAKIDQLKNKNVILMGDFNDEPKDVSIRHITSDLHFHNTLIVQKNTGTIKYQALWQNFDQFIVSKQLFETAQKENLGLQKIGDADFLFEQDKRFSGLKPYRTYIGLKHNSGYSDHLPIAIQIPSDL